MNITSILLKKVISEVDSEIWGQIKPNYLSTEYQALYKVLNNYFEDKGRLPSFDVLKLAIRSEAILNKVYAIELAEDVDISNAELLEYLKNKFVQEEILGKISQYLDESIMIGSAKENVDKLYEIITHIEDRVDLKDPEEDMGRIELFETEEDLKKAFRLGLNAEYDKLMTFASTDYILIGGRRGSGKSLTCSNIAVNTFDTLEKSSIYFTIEMTSRAILQRNCAISTGVDARKIKTRNLDVIEWEKVAKWWASRFDGGHEAFHRYLKHRDFNQLHLELRKCNLFSHKQMDVVYDPSMSLATIRSELDKKVERLNPAVIIVDYVNQVSRSGHRKTGQYDWTEQIEVSKALKAIAQEYKVPVISPYQIDATGEARFAKGLLDSADAAFTLDPHDKEDSCVSFNCVKMRDANEISFTSKADWSNLRFGPETAILAIPDIEEDEGKPKKSKKKRQVHPTNPLEGAYDL